MIEEEAQASGHVPTGEEKTRTCYALKTWIVLGFGLLCLAADAYAMFYLPHHRFQEPRNLHPTPLVLSAAVWTLEIALALLSLWLVRFALTKVPRVPAAY